jgi:hypothetical protein
MNTPKIGTIAAAFAIAVSLGFARDLAHEGISAGDVVSAVMMKSGQPKLFYASATDVVLYRNHDADWRVGTSQKGMLPPATKDANPDQ